MESPLATRPAPALTASGWSFLTAEWRNLCLFNYAAPPELLLPFVPPGLSLDTIDGSAFVSLVAFDFLDTRVLGIPWPGHRNFPEINLRFYVREGERRGVAFIRELVPKRLIAWLARLLYNEPYSARPMSSLVREEEGELHVQHTVHVGGAPQELCVRAQAERHLPSEDTRAHFFKEHTWGYGASRRGRLLRYEVRHEVWQIREVLAWTLKFDFQAVYGDSWAWLNRAKPLSVLLAAGSTIRVSPLQGSRGSGTVGE